MTISALYYIGTMHLHNDTLTTFKTQIQKDFILVLQQLLHDISKLHAFYKTKLLTTCLQL